MKKNNPNLEMATRIGRCEFNKTIQGFAVGCFISSLFWIAFFMIIIFE